MPVDTSDYCHRQSRPRPKSTQSRRWLSSLTPLARSSRYELAKPTRDRDLVEKVMASLLSHSIRGLRVVASQAPWYHNFRTEQGQGRCRAGRQAGRPSLPPRPPCRRAAAPSRPSQSGTVDREEAQGQEEVTNGCLGAAWRVRCGPITELVGQSRLDFDFEPSKHGNARCCSTSAKCWAEVAVENEPKEKDARALVAMRMVGVFYFDASTIEPKSQRINLSVWLVLVRVKPLSFCPFVYLSDRRVDDASAGYGRPKPTGIYCCPEPFLSWLPADYTLTENGNDRDALELLSKRDMLTAGRF
ncbi:hypothetical protein IWX50DRAFT_704256 [Phyllosticta citricarpa]|uniref:Uncharacterized protein n=1 Tax=Phyllosticta citricarpa TaxID=55181 RepID=A0ABR1LI51_9PEZI